MGKLDNIKLSDIESTTIEGDISINAAKSFAEVICKRCNHRRGNHTTMPLKDGSRCIGADKKGCKMSCSGFVE